jgi:hypothetical protein
MCFSCSWLEQSRQDRNHRRFARPVGTEQTIDTVGRDGQVNAIQSKNLFSKAFDQSPGRDGHFIRTHDRLPLQVELYEQMPFR